MNRDLVYDCFKGSGTITAKMSYKYTKELILRCIIGACVGCVLGYVIGYLFFLIVNNV